MAIRVELELDSGDFETGILRAKGSLASLQSQTNSTIVGISKLNSESRSFLSTLRDASVFLSHVGNAIHTVRLMTTGLAEEIVKLNADVERMSSLLKAMSTAADPVKEASDYIKNLREEAKQAPFSLQAMHQAFIRMKAGGLDPAAGSMKALTDAVAAFGGTDETLGRASLAFQEMAGKGVVQMKELRNQLGMAVPQAMQLLARSVGVTYEQLMSDVHTGTVSAKESIEALNLEFERVYGGAAVRQMETFNGQLARMKVIMMDLAIKAGGADDNKDGFFGTIKKQFAEMNDALSGQFGAKLAEQLGNSLTGIVLGMRKAIDVAIEFRSTILSVGEAIAVGFGARLAINSIAGLVSTIAAARVEIALLGSQWAVAMNAIQTSGLLAGIFASGGGVIAALGSTLVALGPMLPLLAGGLVLAAHALGLFKDEAKDAWQEMEKFGANSIKQVEQGAKYVERLETQYQKLLRTRQQWGRLGADGFGANDSKIASAESDLDAARKKLEDYRRAATSEEARKGSSVQVSGIGEDVAGLRRQYSERSNLLDKTYADEVRKASEAGRSTMLIRKQYQDQYKTNALRFYDELIAFYEKKEEELRQSVNKGSDVDREAARKTLDVVRQRIEEQKKLREQEAEQAMGSARKPKAMDDAKLLDKGEKFLDKLLADIAGAKAGLEGLDPEVYSLKEALSQMKFGDEALTGVQELVNKILAAKQEADDLNKILNAQHNLDRDLTNEEIKLKQQLLEAQTDGMSEVDKLIVKVNSGFYDGFGNANTPMQQRLIDLRLKMQQVGVVSMQTGDVLKNSTFGSEPTSAATGFLDVVSKIAGVFTQLKEGASSLNLGAAFSAITQNGSLPIFASGQPVAAGSYMDNLVKAESGGDPNAKASSSSAAGLTQFIESTWLAFLKEMHPEMLAFGKQAALGLRSNGDLSKEAGSWYAQKNGPALSRAGIDPTDANVYAAHHLGPGMAERVLSSDDRLALAAIPGMSKILLANPNLKGMNVADYKNWTEHKFGNGYSWTGARPRYDDDSKLDTPSNITESQRVKFSNLKELEHTLNETKGSKAIADKAKDLANLIEQASEIAEGNNKRLAALKKLIKEGKLDSSDKDPESDRYKSLIKLAHDLDLAEEKRDKAKKARTAANAAREGITAMGAEQKDVAELLRQNVFGDPTNFKHSEAYLRNEKSLRTKLDAVKQGSADGENSDEYKTALEDAQRQRDDFTNNEIRRSVEALKKKTMELRRSLMEEGSARDDEAQKETQRLDSMLRHFTGTEEEKARLVQQKEDYIAAYRAKKAAESPMNKQFKEWGDLAGNFEKQMTSSMATAVDTVAGALVGIKANWKNMLQSLAKDMLKMVLQWSLSSVGRGLKSSTGSVSSKAGAAGGGGSKAGGGIGSLLGVAHTGGIVGGSLNYRSASLSLFANAPRFHTGGIVGANEVPIIAQKGEGVFTKEQMSAMGGMGGQKVSVNMPISVQTQGGGTNEQNQDLARQIGKQVEEVTRSTVINELQNQMRPGNILDSRYARQ